MDSCYWDACVIISYLEREEPTPAHPERHPHLVPIMRDAEMGQHTIYTSVLSITEVAFLSSELQPDGSLEEEVDERIENLWRPQSPLTVVEFSGPIGEIGRGLTRAGKSIGAGLRSVDVIHLATAVWLQVSEFHTYNGRLNKLQQMQGFVPFNICEPKSDHPELSWGAGTAAQPEA